LFGSSSSRFPTDHSSANGADGRGWIFLCEFG
jgi:hypothetical protein